MPNRVIREGMLTSDPVNALTWAGEVFFYRLMLKADDFGRFDARESILRASLYPLKLSEVREADITRWRAECQKAGLIVLYEVGGKRYLEIPKFDQRKRALVSKWPSHDGHMSVICQQSAAEGERRETEKPRSEKRETDAPDGAVVLELIFPKDSTSAFRAKFDKWTVIRKAMGKKPKDWSHMFQEQLDWLEQYGDSQRIEVLSASIMNNWQGLQPPKARNGSTASTAPTEKGVNVW